VSVDGRPVKRCDVLFVSVGGFRSPRLDEFPY
jgi:hypothetical protein